MTCSSVERLRISYLEARAMTDFVAETAMTRLSATEGRTKLAEVLGATRSMVERAKIL